MSSSASSVSLVRWLVPFALLAPGSAALADEGASRPRVSIEITGCELDFATGLRALAAIELRALLVEPGVETAGTTRVTIVCRGEVVELSVVDPLTGKTLQRPVSLEGITRAARTRLLALAVAELVTASWSELTTNPTPALPAAVKPPPPGAAAAARAVVRERTPSLRPRSSAFRIGAMTGARSFFERSGGALGGGLRIERSFRPGLFVSADLLYDRGSVRHVDGSVAVETLSGAAAFGVGHELGPLLGRASRGARFGSAHLTGEATVAGVRGASMSGAWGGPLGRLDAVFWPSAAVSGWLGAEAGYAAVGVRGLSSDGPSVAVQGAWIGASLGALLTF